MNLLHANQLVTLAGPPGPRVGSQMSELGIIEDGALLIDDTGWIVAVGEEAKLQAPEKVTQWGAKGMVVTPGLIDAHAHPIFMSPRLEDFEARAKGESYGQIADRGGGINSSVASVRAATEEQLRDQSWRNVLLMARNGTTTFEAKSGYGLTLEDELKMLRVAKRLGKVYPTVPTLLAAHAVPHGGEKAEYLEEVLNRMIPEAAKQKLAKYVDIFVEQGYFDHDDARRVAAAAKAHGLGLRMHVDQLTNGGGAALAAELGAVTADHLEQTDAAGIAALKRAGVIPVLLPGSVFGLGLSEFPDARAMIDAGLPVVLATDFNPGSSPVPSLPLVMSLACRYMGMSPAEALTACTINAAHSLGLASDRGSLEPGKRADLVIWDVRDYREIAYYAGVEQVVASFRKGQQLDSPMPWSMDWKRLARMPLPGGDE